MNGDALAVGVNNGGTNSHTHNNSVNTPYFDDTYFMHMGGESDVRNGRSVLCLMNALVRFRKVHSIVACRLSDAI